MSKVLIIGGVAGGATAAARLRRLDEHAQIILFERGEHISFANCGLPYYIGGAIPNCERLLLQTPERFYGRFCVDVRILSEVLSIDRAKKTVTVKNLKSGEVYSETYDKLILSPGSVPVKPPIEGIDSKRVFTLRSIADTDKIKQFIAKEKPGRAAVVGGGFIGIEMAENLCDAGLNVSLIEMSSQVLPPFDTEMAAYVHQHLKEKSIALYLNNGLQKIDEHDGGLTVHLQNGVLDTDLLISAIGVKPETNLAKDAGLALNARGGILVDSYMRTSDESIYAVGDAVEVTDFVTKQPAMVPLAGPANKQARIAADNICGGSSEYAGTQGSAILKVFDMTAACTGINEKTATRLGFDYDKVYLWLPGHAGYYPGSQSMAIKVLFEKKNGRILGAQIAGYDGVDKRCDIFAVAVRAGMTAHDLTRLELCYAPPYSSAKDPVNMAGFVIENLLSGKVQNFHWNEVDLLPRDGSALLLDVRTPQEAAQGKIDGFINIPLDSLRKRLNELDKTKPVYIHCHSGMRSYLASRILTQNGFNAYNLSGGYILYKTAKEHCR